MISPFHLCVLLIKSVVIKILLLPRKLETCTSSDVKNILQEQVAGQNFDRMGTNFCPPFISVKTHSAYCK